MGKKVNVQFVICMFILVLCCISCKAVMSNGAFKMEEDKECLLNLDFSSGEGYEGDVKSIIPNLPFRWVIPNAGANYDIVSKYPLSPWNQDNRRRALRISERSTEANNYSFIISTEPATKRYITTEMDIYIDPSAPFEIALLYVNPGNWNEIGHEAWHIKRQEKEGTILFTPDNYITIERGKWKRWKIVTDTETGISYLCEEKKEGEISVLTSVDLNQKIDRCNALFLRMDSGYSNDYIYIERIQVFQSDKLPVEISGIVKEKEGDKKEVLSNILHNGSFEVGIQGWGCYTRGGGRGGYERDIKVMFIDSQPTIEKDDTAPDGSHILKLVMPGESYFRLFSRAYAITSGEYELTGYVKSKRPVGVSLVRADKTSNNVLLLKNIEPSEKWQSVSLKITIPEDISAVAVQILGSNEDNREMAFMFDNFRLSKKGEYIKASEETIDIGIETNISDRVFFVNGNNNLVFKVYSPQTLKGSIIYQIENGWGEVVRKGEIPLDIIAGITIEKQVDLKGISTGHYRVLAQVKGEKGTSYVEEFLFGVIPNRDLGKKPEDAWDSRFGCEMENRPFIMELARKIGIRWVFCLPPLFTRWECTEPLKGEWKFYNEEIKKFRDMGFHLVGTLTDPPYWATEPGSKNYGGPWPNTNIPSDFTNWKEWKEYVQKVVSGYYPEIKHWAVWNEPNHPGYLPLKEGEDWVTKYINILKPTYEIVKTTKPEAKVVGGVVTNPGALPPLIQSGSNYMDIVAFHWASWSPKGYLRNTGEEMGFLGPKQNWVNCIERVTDAMETTGKKMPVWNTECHITQAEITKEFRTHPPLPREQGTPPMTSLDAAAGIVRQYVTEWAAGVEKTFYWLFATQESSWEVRADKTFLEYDRSPCAPLITYAVMTHFLEDAEFVKWEKQVDTSVWIERPTFWIFYFKKKDGSRIRVVWSNTDAPHELLLDVSGKTAVYDMFGGYCPNPVSMSGMELKGQVMLCVGRFPFYVVDNM
ncbi:MAG: hypothetical protein N3D17_00565 [bacterium]|nr:hypothetical protein [bacterium]